MKKKYVLDTHTILWYLEGSPKLTHKVQIILNEIDQGVAHGFIPVIALAEVAYIQRKKGIPLFETIFNFVTSHIHLTICPVELSHVAMMNSLSLIPEMHDRLIAALAKSLDAILVTRDRAIQQSQCVPVLWND